MEDISRRNFVRNASTSALAVGIAGLAGCTSSLPVVGDSSGGPGVENWLAAPSFADILDEDELAEYYEDPEFEGAEDGTRAFEYTVPEPFFDNEEETNAYSQLSSGSTFRSRVGVSATEIDWQLYSHTNWEFEFTHTERDWSGEEFEQDGSSNTHVRVRALSGSFDPDDIEDSLERWAEDEYDDEDSLENWTEERSVDDEALSSESEYEEFDLYAFEGYAFGVSEAYVVRVAGSQSLDSLEALEAAIDVQRTSVGGLSETDDGDALLAQFESAHLASGELHEPRTVESEIESHYGDIDDVPEWQRDELEAEFEDRLDDWELGLVGSASAYEFDGETTDVHEVSLFESASDADADELRDHVESNRDVTDQWATIEDLSVDDEGRALVLSGRVRTRALL